MGTFNVVVVFRLVVDPILRDPGADSGARES